MAQPSPPPDGCRQDPHSGAARWGRRSQGDIVDSVRWGWSSEEAGVVFEHLEGSPSVDIVRHARWPCLLAHRWSLQVGTGVGWGGHRPLGGRVSLARATWGGAALSTGLPELRRQAGERPGRKGNEIHFSFQPADTDQRGLAARRARPRRGPRPLPEPVGRSAETDQPFLPKGVDS